MEASHETRSPVARVRGRARAIRNRARAELFRCTGPDGKTIFTDQKNTCPGAEPSEPTGVVHRAETPESHQSAPDPGTSAPAALSRDPHAADASEAAQWKQKKRDAEQQVAKLQAQREAMDRFVSHCNRPGRYVKTRDDAGISRSSAARSSSASSSSRESGGGRAHYLATGLPEECRRAGCLPGWLR
jgi:hypothetical protein